MFGTKAAIAGHAKNVAFGVGVFGKAEGPATGVAGEAVNGPAIFGGSSFGVGVLGRGYSTYGGYFSGAQSALMLEVSNTTPPPQRADIHQEGEISHGPFGELWACVGVGTPGQWRKLAGPTTVGQLHLLAVPVRAYDSRSSSGPASTGQGPLASGSSRIVSLASGFIGATGTTAVPSGAVGALVNIAAVNTSNRGFLAVFNASEDWPGHANLNWDASGAVVSNQATSLVDNLRRVEVQAGGADASADFVIDVVGYYM